MNWLLYSAAGLVGLVGAVFLVGAMFPLEHTVTQVLELSQPPDAVWQVLVDYENQSVWRTEIKKAERLPEREGRAVWKQTYKDGTPVTLEIAEMTAPTRLVEILADVGGPFVGQWEYKLTATEKGSRLTLTEKGQMKNPFFRFVYHAILGKGKFIGDYLKALAKKFGEKPVIQAK
jgi:uncharacterized protein YndB with AHSA1/START domain